MIEIEDITPMPAETPAGCCPNCGTALRAPSQHRREGDFGVCAHCCAILIIMENGEPRLPSFDEIVLAEADPRVRLMVSRSIGLDPMDS